MAKNSKLDYYEILSNAIETTKRKLVGISVYILYSQQKNEFLLYKLSFKDNSPIYEIIKNCIDGFDPALEITHYNYDVKPDGKTTILAIPEKDIPNYTINKEKITKDIHAKFYERNLLELRPGIKGYIIRGTFLENNKQNHILFFSRLTKSQILQPKSKMFSFGDNGDIMAEINIPILKLYEKIVAINFQSVMFVLNRKYFEDLFHYNELIEEGAKNALKRLQTFKVVHNFPDFETHVLSSAFLKRKLFKIGAKGGLENIEFNTFESLKHKFGDKLLFLIDSKEKKVFISEDNKYKAITQILRILNDEPAETYIGKKFVFASEKIPIE